MIETTEPETVAEMRARRAALRAKFFPIPVPVVKAPVREEPVPVLVDYQDDNIPLEIRIKKIIREVAAKHVVGIRDLLGYNPAHYPTRAEAICEVARTFPELLPEEIAPHFKRSRLTILGTLKRNGITPPKRPLFPVAINFTRDILFVSSVSIPSGASSAPPASEGPRVRMLNFRSSIERVISEVAAEHEVTVGDIKGPRRSSRYVRARFDAVARVAVEFPQLSLPQIGRIFGDRDHTTILHALRRKGVVRKGAAA